MKLQEKVQILFAAIDEAEKQEDSEHSGLDLIELGQTAKITSKKLETAVKQMEEDHMRNGQLKPVQRSSRN